MLSDEDRAWLVALNDELWPEPGKSVIVLEALRKLTYDEVDRICALIDSAPLVTSMFMKGMFGGYGMDLLEHPNYPALPPSHLLRLTEDHLPGPRPPSSYDHLRGTVKPRPPEPKKKPGCGLDHAWDLFSKFTHSARNREWLKSYGLREPGD